MPFPTHLRSPPPVTIQEAVVVILDPLAMAAMPELWAAAILPLAAV
jgi:hypothetical protein